MNTQEIMDVCMKFVTGEWYRDKNPPEGTDVYTLIHRVKEDHLMVSEILYAINMGYCCNGSKRIISNQEKQGWIEQRNPDKVKDTKILEIINKDHKPKL